MKELQLTIQDLTGKQVILKNAIARGEFAHENILRAQAASDLGLSEDEVSKPPEKKTENTHEAIFHTASAEEGRSEFVSSTETVAVNGAPDFSGTTLAIASVGDNLRSEARKTDQLIKKLLAAALSGNWEAIKMALVFLDKRASIITIGMGAQTIKSMQFYEKSMSALSNSLGKLKGNEPDYNSKLAKINSEMNLYSLNRQAIANFLRDTLTMREEIANLTHSVLQKDSQIVSSIAR